MKLLLEIVQPIWIISARIISELKGLSLSLSLTVTRLKSSKSGLEVALDQVRSRQLWKNPGAGAGRAIYPRWDGDPNCATCEITRSTRHDPRNHPSSYVQASFRAQFLAAICSFPHLSAQYRWPKCACQMSCGVSYKELPPSSSSAKQKRPMGRMGAQHGEAGKAVSPRHTGHTASPRRNLKNSLAWRQYLSGIHTSRPS